MFMSSLGSWGVPWSSRIRTFSSNPGMLDLERLAAGIHVQAQGSFRSKTARSLGIVLVFLPSRDIQMRANGVMRHPLAVIPHAIFLDDSLDLLGVHPEPALGVVIAERQVFGGAPVIGPEVDLGQLDRFPLGLRVVTRTNELTSTRRVALNCSTTTAKART